MLWSWLRFEDGSPRDQSFRSGSAAFLNESIIREIITGKYLNKVVSRSNERCNLNAGAYTTLPLIAAKKNNEDDCTDSRVVATYVAGMSWIAS